MRKMIAALAVMSVSSVYAAEELKFGDANYFLKQGQFNLVADASATYYRETPKGTDTKETRAYLFETRYAYAYTDQLNFFLGLDYAYDAKVTNRTTTSNSAYYQSGLANPALGVNYRYLNQNNWRYNVDFGAVVKVQVQDSELGSSTGNNSRDGSNAAPGSSLELNAKMGRKWNIANEWQLAGGFIYHLSGDYKFLNTNGNPDVEGKQDSSMDLYVRATYQYRPVNEFMMSLSAQGTRVGEVTGNFGTSDSTQDSHVDMDFVYRAKYLILENLTANFHYGMSRNQNVGQEIGGTDFELKQRRENYYGIGVDFLF